ncbi:vWA domain-containing protein [Adlercreutzia faecimuris]|uniref:VWA-like domain-containing protein n=1 Tax=Adlercreutzia faecimuris TaxID=2897341 RepID=A0ABS9WFN6_9ACTN|nr:VWA-like domain-containing protein [Adlercreutzia sp. JBNU-10]MCI2241132.1 VWA-like domain-containing protein [Adlercreutzia sp. JBNU-10]
MALRDETPIAEGDVALLARAARERLAADGRADGDGERVSLATEERMARRRARFEACAPVAAAILEEARTTLAVRFRFLDRALWRMPLVPLFELYGISSDGRSLVYDPVYVVDRFRLGQAEVVRDVAHCLFHCIFRHPFLLYSVLRKPWDVACDIAIEALILDLMGDDFPSNMDRRARQSLRLLRAQVDGVITAERLYHLFSNEGNKVDLASLAPLFCHDSHALWYADAEDPAPAGGAEAADAGQGRPEGGARTAQGSDVEALDEVAEGPVEVPRPDGGAAADDAGDEAAAASGDAGRDAPDDAAASGEGAGGADGAPEAPGAAAREELARAWEDVGRQMQVELETRLIRQGEGAGSLAVALRAVNRETGDYGAFLRRFAALHEALGVNDDEFDYIYYTYGLARYGNLPLIEPLEYREDRRIRDFVIAVDTSESCSGAVVQAFMRKTYTLLKQSESFHDRVCVHVIQCDARVQEDTVITSLEALELYLDGLELKGFGGTDFRPVFDHVARLQERGELRDLRGLIYFTDGEGTYPRKPPPYDAAFVFLDDGYSDPQVPPWALKVIMDERELGVGSVTVAEPRRDREGEGRPWT